MTAKHNCFYGGSNDDDALATSKTNIAGDPKFVAATEDFHLQPGSPCLGAGEKKSDIGAPGKGKNPVIENPKPAAKATGMYKVTVNAEDSELGEKVLAVLTAGGFASSESYVCDDPDFDASIKYGTATKDDVKAMRKLISVFYDGKLEEEEAFDSDDYDVFINLP